MASTYPSEGGEYELELARQEHRRLLLLIEDSIEVARLLRKRQIESYEAAEPSVIESEVQEVVVQYNDFPDDAGASTGEKVSFAVDPNAREIRGYVLNIPSAADVAPGTILYSDGASWIPLAPGSPGNSLKLDGSGLPIWA